MTQVFRPSQSGHWSKCAAYARFTRDVPETTNDAAREGTCAAWVAEMVLNDHITDANLLVGKSHQNGWVVTQPMVNDVNEYINRVNLLVGDNAIIKAEDFLVASEEPRIQGTADVSAVNDRILDIIDLKYGRTIVETTSSQLVCYGWGKFRTLPAGSIDKIRLSIYQPRAVHRDGTFRTRTVTPDQLHQEFTNIWVMAVENQRSDSIATPGPHCDYCEAAASCEALAHSVYKFAEFVQSRSQRDMTPSELGQELDFIDRAEKTINARFRAIKTEAEARMKRESIPGWTMRPKKGNRVFTQPALTLHLMTGVDPTVKELCTPAELERRGADKEVVKKLTKQPTTSMKLTRITSEQISDVFDA